MIDLMEVIPHLWRQKGRDETFISRIREDKTIKNGLNMWIVSDNLLRGAALNAVEIAETLIKNNFYGK